MVTYLLVHGVNSHRLRENLPPLLRRLPLCGFLLLHFSRSDVDLLGFFLRIACRDFHISRSNVVLNCHLMKAFLERETLMKPPICWTSSFIYNERTWFVAALLALVTWNVWILAYHTSTLQRPDPSFDLDRPVKVESTQNQVGNEHQEQSTSDSTMNQFNKADLHSICRWSRPDVTWEHHPEPWVAFLVMHMISNDVPRNLDHLYGFNTPEYDGRVQVFVATINADAEPQTICIGQADHECVPRRVLSPEYLQQIKGSENDWWFKYHSKTMQQMSDIRTSISLYRKVCEPYFPQTIFWSLLDDDNGPCPGTPFHLAQIAHFGKVSELARSGDIYGIRMAPGSSGFLFPSRNTRHVQQLLEWTLEGGQNWTHMATDDLLDRWASGTIPVPGDPPIRGAYMYYMVVLEHLGDRKSHFLPDQDVRNRKVNTCGMRMHWPHFLERHDECKYGALDPCPAGVGWDASLPGLN